MCGCPAPSRKCRHVDRSQGHRHFSGRRCAHRGLARRRRPRKHSWKRLTDRDPDFQVPPGAHRRVFTNMTPDGSVGDGRVLGLRRLPARDPDPRRPAGAPRTFRCTRGRLHQVDHTCFLTILPKLSHISFLTTAVAIADTALEVVDDEARGRGGVKNDG